MSNVVFWCEQHGYEPTDARVEKILNAAKAASRLLTDEELRKLAG